MASACVTPMANTPRFPNEELRDELKELRKDIASLSRDILPEFAVIKDQVRGLQINTAQISGDMRLCSTKTEMAALKVQVDLELQRFFSKSQEAHEANSNMIDNHDDRLRDIEQSNGEIKVLLNQLKDTVGDLNKTVAFIRDKMWWFIGIGSGVFGLIEFLSHKTGH